MQAPMPRIRLVAAIGLATLAAGLASARGEDPEPKPCNIDAMLVFDASGSMAGNVDQGIATLTPRIDVARAALAKVLPTATRDRKVGLITYGPGPYNQCNVHLSFPPRPNAAQPIIRDVNALIPAGKTPLATAVQQAADVLDYRTKPGVIVVITDGEETCGGAPCDLGKKLHAEGLQLTVHVIGYRLKGSAWTGEQSVFDAQCMAESTGGLYITAETEDDLVQALEKTLDCPMMSDNALR